MTITELVKRFGGELEGEGSAEVCGVTGVEFARDGDATFASDEALLKKAEESPACCIIAPRDARPSSKPLIRCESPNSYAADLLEFFYPAPPNPPGIHPTAVVDPTAKIHETASIGSHAVVGRDCRIGRRACLMSSVCVGDRCEIGDDTFVYPSVVIYAETRVGSRVTIHAGAVLGADGFGYFPEGGLPRKWPHVGNVVIEDDVEVGANSCIDRAKFGTTLIERGAKIDNLVQVAHNCRVGPASLIAAQTGLSGSVVLEAGVACGGQVGIADHNTIGAGAQLGAQSGVIGNVPAGSITFGTPQRPLKQALQESAMLTFLTDNRRTVRNLVRRAASS